MHWHDQLERVVCHDAMSEETTQQGDRSGLVMPHSTAWDELVNAFSDVIQRSICVAFKASAQTLWSGTPNLIYR